MLDANLFAMLLPKDAGGAACGRASFFETVEAVSEADGATDAEGAADAEAAAESAGLAEATADADSDAAGDGLAAAPFDPV